MTSDFYIGWEANAAPDLGRFVRMRVVILLLLALGIGAALTTLQRPFAAAEFEFGVETTLEGRLERHPYPVLVVESPAQSVDSDGENGASGRTARTERVLLTVFGKRGADEAVAGLDGHRVRLVGSRILREGRKMLEVLPERTEDLGPAPPGPDPVALGQRTYFGEIVDAKCWLGVMKPGHLKPHRACATRCIAGGVPPMLVARAVDGRATVLLLAGADGRALGEELSGLIAEPVQVTGEVLRYDNLLILRADLDAFIRVEK